LGRSQAPASAPNGQNVGIQPFISGDTLHVVGADANNKDKLLTKDELATYIESHAKLWAMLGVNLNLGEEGCQEIATHVAFVLAVKEEKQSSLTKEEFHKFREKYVVDPEGNQEFFHRTVFATFDKDNNGVLDAKELDHFLDIFYEAG
jgi:hypothetical protein